MHNHGPETVRDFVRQRRRIAAGHYWLRDVCGYAVSTMDVSRIARLTLSELSLRTPTPHRLRARHHRRRGHLARARLPRLPHRQEPPHLEDLGDDQVGHHRRAALGVRPRGPGARSGAGAAGRQHVAHRSIDARSTRRLGSSSAARSELGPARRQVARPRAPQRGGAARAWLARAGVLVAQRVPRALSLAGARHPVVAAQSAGADDDPERHLLARLGLQVGDPELPDLPADRASSSGSGSPRPSTAATQSFIATPTSSSAPSSRGRSLPLATVAELRHQLRMESGLVLVLVADLAARLQAVAGAAAGAGASSRSWPRSSSASCWRPACSTSSTATSPIWCTTALTLLYWLTPIIYPIDVRARSRTRRCSTATRGRRS